MAHPNAATPPTETLSAAELALYTRSNEAIVVVSPRIRALAARLAGPELKPGVAVQRFWNFILDEFTCGVVHYDELDSAYPTDWILDSGWFDCHLGSALLVALCRARGIAARMISGYLLYASPAYHYWAEIRLEDRWAPFDLLASDLSMRGRDPAWRDYFAGALDYRMKTQCLPRTFNFTPSVRFPPAWHQLLRAEPHGTEIHTFDIETGKLVYRDRIFVERGMRLVRAYPALPTISLTTGTTVIRRPDSWPRFGWHNRYFAFVCPVQCATTCRHLLPPV